MLFFNFFGVFIDDFVDDFNDSFIVVGTSGIPSKKSRTSVKQIREIFEGMPDVPTTINESLKLSSNESLKSSIKTPKKLKKSN